VFTAEQKARNFAYYETLTVRDSYCQRALSGHRSETGSELAQIPTERR